MTKNLVIVESPAKAKTINKYLGRDYQVKASMGHVRDLPKKRVAVRVPGAKKSAAKPKVKGAKAEPRGIEIAGVDIAQGFHPQYEILATRKKIMDEIKAAAADAPAIFLAADPDREGEAICWHIAEELSAKARKKVKRVVFHEITKKAVAAGLRAPRRHRREEGGRAAGAPGARPPGGLRREPDPLGEGQARQLGGPRAVGGAAPHLRARTRDQGVRQRGILDGRRPPRRRQRRRPSSRTC